MVVTREVACYNSRRYLHNSSSCHHNSSSYPGNRVSTAVAARTEKRDIAKKHYFSAPPLPVHRSLRLYFICRNDIKKVYSRSEYRILSTIRFKKIDIHEDRCRYVFRIIRHIEEFPSGLGSRPKKEILSRFNNQYDKKIIRISIHAFIRLSLFLSVST